MKAFAKNESQPIFASAARTETENSSDQVNPTGRGALFCLAISAASGTTPTLDVKIQAKDPTSEAYIDIPGASFAQKNATGNDSLVVYPGIGETANRSVNDILPRHYRAVATIAGTTPSFTFTLTAQLMI